MPRPLENDRNDMRILLVEDDRALGEGIRTALRPEGYTVDWLQDGASACSALNHESFELAILDLGLPRLDGLEVLKRLRAATNPVPVLVLTARDATGDRIAGLDAGADDYLVKPFDVAELKARLRALLRRSFNRPEPVLEYRGILLDPVNQQVSYQGTPINLPRKEFVLLHELLAQPGRVLTRDRQQQVVYGWDEDVESNALEVHIHHLRKKFFPELIRTVRGVGYLVDKC
jgi:two-component system response regulator QseB